MTFADTMRAALAGYGPRHCIEFEGTWYTGTDLERWTAATDVALTAAGLAPGEPIGLVVRNRPAHAAVILGCLAGGRPVSMIYSYQSESAIAQDIRTLGPPAIVADPQDWTPAAQTAAQQAGSAAIAVSLAGAEPLSVRTGPPVATEPGLDILTSGTTGPPKRMHLATDVLQHNVLSMTLGQAVSPEDAPALVFWPFGSVGVCQLLAAAYSGQRIVLLEKFTVDAWVDAVKRHGVRWSGVQPTVIRMLLEADVDPADLASLDYLPGGSGPLEPALQRRFEERYGVPLIWGYGATEFAGTACSWTPQLRAEFGDTKPGTVGRPLPGVQVRITQPETGEVLSAGEQGYLSARVSVLGPDWIATTDIASVDADGFVTVHGRGDGAINRGGFKVLPERIRRALLTHPAVRDACVVAVPDPRLGEVPFAAVELLSGAPVPTEEELKETVRQLLPSPSVPVAIHCLAELPRNAVMKVRVDAIRDHYSASTRRRNAT